MFARIFGLTPADVAARFSPAARSALAASALSTLLAICLMSSTGQDDSHITYWAARALAEHGAIVNYGGQRVEQSSSLLHTLVLTLLYRVTPFTMPTLGYLVGIVAAALAVLRSTSFAVSRGLDPGFALALAAATTPLVCYWMLGGLETTLAAWLFVELALVQLGVLEGTERLWSPRTLFVQLAFVAVRPESFFVAACALVGVALLQSPHLAIRDRRPAVLRALGRVAALGLLLGGAFALITLFRQLYFGSLFPQPVSVKLGSEPLGIVAVQGLQYLLGELLRADVGAAAMFGLLGLFCAVRSSEALAEGLLSSLAGSQLGFVAMVGGDWMVGARFIAMILPLLYLLAFLLLSRASLQRRVLIGLGVGLTAINLLSLTEFAMRHAPGRPLWVQLRSDAAIRAAGGETHFPWVDRANQTHTRDLLASGELSRTIERILTVKPTVTLMSGQAGMMMYYAASRHFGRIDFIDRHGLTSRHLERFRAELGVAPTGLVLEVDDYFRLASQSPDAGLLPDVVFDISPERRAAAERHGYVCVYEQSGRMSPSRRERPGPPGKPPPERRPPDWFTIRGHVYQFIAVRKDLVEPVLGSSREPKKLEWNAVF